MAGKSGNLVGGRVSLEDKWTIEKGRVLLSGTQAIGRMLLAQRALDAQRGLNTAGYITGYRGSPLGGVDTMLWSISKRLEAAGIRFQPGINEDLAATAIRGTQQLDAVPGALVDGVFAAWYGKGPGVDRSGDALKHGNFAGAHAKGGVLILYGDDHGGKSSTVAHHSEQAVAAALIPSLYPSDVAEMVHYGLLGFALSRYSGSWVGLKLVNEVAEQTMTVDLDLPEFVPVLPEAGAYPPEGLHNHVGPFAPLREESVVTDFRLPFVQRFVRANAIDRVMIRSPRSCLGLVTAGKSHGDTMRALSMLGLDSSRCETLGLSLYKLGCIWPVEPEGVREFAAGLETLFVIEEKKAFVEQQIAAILINETSHPRVIGKVDEEGRPLLHPALQLEPAAIAIAIVDRLERLGIVDQKLMEARRELSSLFAAPPAQVGGLPRRSPYFCSGCPHNRSTRVPSGSLSMTGIGCHTMVNFVRPREALLPTQMGGEGANWIGLAPFTTTNHIFQNMGDGTYYHSGLLAIRAAVAAGVNVTYKILYNDAVAMTGGQPVDGPISVAEIVQQVRHEGVSAVVLVSDNPAAHRCNPALPKDLRIEHRDALDQVQLEVRDIAGCSIIIYEQTCAAEKRRRRKRKLYPDPPTRLFISKAVCEACGDCSVQSTCVSLTTVETPFGAKREIDQSSCNKDYSCLNGFCPSFLTIRGAERRKQKEAALAAPDEALPEPSAMLVPAGGYNIMVAGIGGTGVITAAALLGMAAHIEGKTVSLFDMTGLAQKNGAVYSHVRIGEPTDELHAQRIGRGETDLLLGFDLVAALAAEASETLREGRSKAIVNSSVAPTVALQFERDDRVDHRLLLRRLERLVGAAGLDALHASGMASDLLGDVIGSNLFMIGVAVQKGLLPLAPASIQEAIRLNGAAVEFNLQAFALGRCFVERPTLLSLPPATRASAPPLDELVAHRTRHLAAYQDEVLAERYQSLVERVHLAEQAIVPGSERVTTAVARNYAKLLAYKDEYEVARLLTDPSLSEELRTNFADGARISFNLAPPIFAGTGSGRPRKREFDARWMMPLLQILKRLKFLRGTVLDPFGRNRDRRTERQLIADYEQLVECALGRLTPASSKAVEALLSLADDIRGFGPVKEASVEAYRRRVEEAVARLDAGDRESTPKAASRAG